MCQLANGSFHVHFLDHFECANSTWHFYILSGNAHLHTQNLKCLVQKYVIWDTLRLFIKNHVWWNKLSFSSWLDEEVHSNIFWPSHHLTGSSYFLSVNSGYLRPLVTITTVLPSPMPPYANTWCPVSFCRSIVTRTMRLRQSTPAPVTWPTDAAQNWATPTWTDTHTLQQSPYAQTHPHSHTHFDEVKLRRIIDP